MLALTLVIVVLVATNVATGLALLRHRRAGSTVDDAVEVFEAPRPSAVTSRDRRLITVEILNPIELATNHGGRLGGLAGTLVPGFTRRMVYDRTLATLRTELDRMAVHADVRLHTLRAVARAERGGAAQRGTPVVDAVVVDEVAPLDLGPDV